MSLSNFKRCFFDPDTKTIIDLINPATGKGAYGGHTLEQIRREHAGAIEGDFDECHKLHEDSFKTPPQWSDEEKFLEALECLPPLDWQRRNGAETFKMSELTSGNITAIYCRIGKDFFYLSDSQFMTHEEIVRACELFRDAQPKPAAQVANAEGVQ